ncbi:uncharacterized protein EI90DRAFT_3289308 [Cantharellus anzutake]|uniref:uncharacterized protein n=1 Tax=Cantharellus anzutake TaxID=1750568 RepID=UPI00190770D9|nr:uncharacterized protein EI90DRAFT_3289308 [Cantharellus anzutake]KAF8332120.1 hypothetical protein EI90DRAFT_3289308 [Cantharellus anzutake]
MKKLFRSHKPKTSPTPVPRNPSAETPIHAQFAKTPAPASPRSSDMTTNDDSWVEATEPFEQQQSHLATLDAHVDSKPLSGVSEPPISLPSGQPHPQLSSPISPVSYSPAFHHSNTHSSALQSQQFRPSSPTKTPQPQVLRKRPTISTVQSFPWTDSRTPPDQQLSNGANNKEDKSSTSIETNKESPPMISTTIGSVGGGKGADKEPKESTLDALGNFLFKSKDRHHDHDRDRRSVHKESKQLDPPWDLTAAIGQITATGSEDWGFVLELCERVSVNETTAKEAARALRREFKYAIPASQLSAARLWAIMLRNAKPVFVEASASKKNMDAVEDVITSSKTAPVVKERLLEVLGYAAYDHGRGDRKHPFVATWRKVKPPEAPDQGIPPNLDDPMFRPPEAKWPPHSDQHPSVHQHHGNRPADALRTLRRSTGHIDFEHERSQLRSPTVRLPTLEEEMARVYKECEEAQNLATMFHEQLVYATAASVEDQDGDILRGFYERATKSRDRAQSQVPWAQSLANKATAARKEQRLANANHVTTNDTQHTRQTPSGGVEEHLLGTLLATHQSMVEVCKIYEDLLRVAAAEREERYVQERSRVEIRIDRSNVFVAPDGSLYAPERDVGGGSSSRPASPNTLNIIESSPPTSPPSVPPTIQPGFLQAEKGYPTYNHPPHIQSSPWGSNNPYLDKAPLTSSSLPLNPHSPQPHTPATPFQFTPFSGPHRTAPHGPRAQHTYSRSPSPDVTLHDPRTRAVTETPPPGTNIEITRNALERVAISTPQPLHLNAPTTTGRDSPQSTRRLPDAVSSQPPERSQSLDDLDNEEHRTPIRPSAKALGKRKAVERRVDPDTFDPDDLFKEQRSNTPTSGDSDSDDSLDYLSRSKAKPIVYAYDAMAEREKERQAQLARQTQANGVAVN